MKKLLTIALALVLVCALATASAATKLVIGASSTPHAEILEAAKDLLAAKDIELDIVVFDDYVQPNLQLDAGDLDANYFQHIPYLESFCADNGTKLVSAGAVHYEPMGIYSNLKKAYTVDTIPEKAVIAVPNDPTNEARALLLLQQAGLITLKDPENLAATPNDITDNPHKITFREIEAAATPRALEDVDFAAINGNYAQEAGLHAADALVLEEASGVAFEQYANIICTSSDKAKDERIAALVAVLTTDEFKTYLKDTFGEDVLAAF
jgi:D-methionine transport system substrate-binding protein